MILPALMFWRYYKTPLFPAGYNRAIGTRFNSIPSIVTNGKSSTSADLDEITSKSPRLKTVSSLCIKTINFVIILIITDLVSAIQSQASKEL